MDFRVSGDSQLIYASQVMEHVPDDRRVLADMFGQWDHVRQYGVDFADLIADVGINVRCIGIVDFGKARRARMGLRPGDKIICRPKTRWIMRASNRSTAVKNNFSGLRHPAGFCRL